MKERPIIFSDAMVRAILDWKKTQTRRVIKFEKLSGVRSGRLFYSNTFDSWAIEGGEANVTLVKCPHGDIGDRLWVREAWLLADAAWNIIEGSVDVSEQRSMNVVHRVGSNPPSHYKPRWRPSIHMPRWASRITLEITDVRVERVASISEEDAKAEGCDAVCHCGDTLETHRRGCYEHSFVTMTSAVEEFAELWDSIHGVGAWSSNPFVWVLSFKRVV